MSTTTAKRPMHFPGKEHEVVAPQAKPLRKFRYMDWGGRWKTMEAHVIQFAPEHVLFWIERPGKENRLVLAERNSDVQHLTEVTE